MERPAATSSSVKNGRPAARFAIVVADRVHCFSTGSSQNRGRNALRNRAGTPSPASWRSTECSRRMPRSASFGNPVRCWPIAAWLLTPDSSVVCPVALCGTPGTPRTASIARAQPPWAAGTGPSSAAATSPRRNTSPP